MFRTFTIWDSFIALQKWISRAAFICLHECKVSNKPVKELDITSNIHYVGQTETNVEATFYSTHNLSFPKIHSAVLYFTKYKRIYCSLSCFKVIDFLMKYLKMYGCVAALPSISMLTEFKFQMDFLSLTFQDVTGVNKVLQQLTLTGVIYWLSLIITKSFVTKLL